MAILYLEHNHRTWKGGVIMDETLWPQKVLEDEYSEEQQVHPEEALREGEVELAMVPTWLRPLLWKAYMLEKETQEVIDSVVTDAVVDMTIPAFLKSKSVDLGVVRAQIRLLHANLWGQMKRLNPNLNGLPRLAIRADYKIVEPAEDPEEEEQEEELVVFVLHPLEEDR